MKDFDLNALVLAYSDDEAFCIIRSSTYPQVTGIRRSMVVATLSDRAEERFREALGASSTDLMDRLTLDYTPSNGDMKQTPGSVLWVIVRTSELYAAYPQLQRGRNEELLERYQKMQREEPHEPLTERELVKARALWTERVGYKGSIRANPAVDIGRPTIACQDNY